MEDYKNLVQKLLLQKKYPVLLNSVILEIYYKQLDTKESGITYNKYNTDPEIVFNEINKPYDLIHLKDIGKYFSVHIKNYADFSMSRLPLKCKRIKFYKNDAISETLNLHCITFEEELYHFIRNLNYDIPKIKSLLNINFIECTTFIPISIKLKVLKYKTENIEGVYTKLGCFGPNKEILQVRLLEGQLSNCTLTTQIVSLRDHYQFLNHLNSINFDLPSFVHNYHCYNIHFSTTYNSYIPLAYNPLENPIIHEKNLLNISVL